ncbi:MAG: thiamine-phosphate kinase [Deltaproteobacteria bacterium]|nr:thiamine-phosphate kinase [Deltaproteobacteria bacterium]MBW2073023.1 thiamine-phosphate kinase [Deltaproteobacteria bacterium]
MKLKDIGEFGFIERIRRGCLLRPSQVLRGIGDDCGVFRMGEDLVALFTTDMLVEEVHFNRDEIPADKLGRKALAVNLSDIAAMGGAPREALVSIAVPETVELAYLESLYEGMKSLAREFAVNLLGGDTSFSPKHIVVNVAVIGEASEKEIVYRSGAEVGDTLFVTGPVGSSAAGLDIVRTGRTLPGAEELLEAHFNPRPHVRAGRLIGKSRLCHALIDVSDGLAADLGHLCRESRVGAVIEAERIPTTSVFQQYCAKYHLEQNLLSLHTGEDYVLLGAVPSAAADRVAEKLRAQGCKFYPIGRTVEEEGLWLRQIDGTVEKLEYGGWDHFSSGGRPYERNNS